MPEAVLRLWQVEATTYHFFVTWQFRWSRSIHVVDQDMPEFYALMGAAKDQDFDYHLAHHFRREFHVMYGDCADIKQVRYGFTRENTGGNIIEIVIDNAKSDILVAQTVAICLANAFRFMDQQLTVYHNADSIMGGSTVRKIASSSDFYREYSYTVFPRVFGHPEPARIMHAWAVAGPEPYNIRELELPVGV